MKNTRNTYLDPDLQIAERVDLLLSQMFLDEKIGQMCMFLGEPPKGDSPDADRTVDYFLSLGETAELIRKGHVGSMLSVPTVKEANELQAFTEKSRLGIPLLIATDAIHGHAMYGEPATVFPTPIGIASSFDIDLAERIARTAAAEMRATGFHWTFSPHADITRDPRWGRCGETFGEDSFLVSEMAASMVRGYQGEDRAGRKNVLACAKHFVSAVAYNGLNGAPADVSERTLHEVFFSPFKRAVETGVWSIMPAHNEVNGVPCHAHKKYLRGLVRKQWGFDGLFVSDWMDIERLASVHNIASSVKDAVRIAVNAGLDIHMHGPFFFDNLKDLVLEGSIPESRIDESVRRILFVKFNLGLFENRYANESGLKKILRKKEHLDLALEAVRKSIVLLENKNGCLPLSKNIRSVFITGPNADNQAILGDWSRFQPEENVSTVLSGIIAKASKQTRVDHLPCDHENEITEEMIVDAGKRATLSDAVILALGESSLRFGKTITSGENVDRASLDLPDAQIKLAKSVAASGKPVIVVLVNGGPIASPWLAENADAIIEAWEPGIRGGEAIAEVIFGEHNPCGRMPISVPRSVGQIPCFYDYKPSAFHRGRYYQFDISPLYEFGFGLSYTRFAYSDLQMPDEIGQSDDLEVRFAIENEGECDGEEVVLVFIRDLISSVTTPVRKLAAFTRINLAKDEKREVMLTIPNARFMLFDCDMNRIVEPGDFEIIVGNELLRGIVRVS
jgi:beta-glucosidase